MAIVSIIGVHGVGKTLTAQYLRELYGFNYRQLEAIDIASKMDYIRRQLTFFTSFITSFTREIYLNKNNTSTIPLVFDSHPLLVIPYTMYWLRGNVDNNTYNEIIECFMKLLKYLPKIDLLVYIKPLRIETVIERIKMRSRFNYKEECNREYINFIDTYVDKIYREYGSSIAENNIIVPAEIEAPDRAKIIYNTLFNEEKYTSEYLQADIVLKNI